MQLQARFVVHACKAVIFVALSKGESIFLYIYEKKTSKGENVSCRGAYLGFDS
jgi:hypothetical protein